MSEAHHLWPRLILAAAGLLGAAGVALGAVSAHLGGGEFAKLASLFLILHAAALPGIVAVSIGRDGFRLTAASMLALGAVLFSGDLAVLGFTGRTPVPGMAPTGGFLLIGGWLLLAGTSLFSRQPATER